VGGSFQKGGCFKIGAIRRSTQRNIGVRLDHFRARSAKKDELERNRRLNHFKIAVAGNRGKANAVSLRRTR